LGGEILKELRSKVRELGHVEGCNAIRGAALKKVHVKGFRVQGICDLRKKSKQGR